MNRLRLEAKPLRGQNMVEAVLVLPLFIVLTFGLFELAHFWQVSETTKMVAVDAISVTAKTQSPGLGTAYLINRLNQAQLRLGGPTGITTSPDGGSYAVRVTVWFEPYFGGLVIPTLTGPISIIPAQVPIRYQEIKSVSIL